MNIQEEEVLFFVEVGWALRQWAAVEGQLRALISMSVHPTDGPAIAEGFMSIENFRSKLKFCNQIVRRRFSDSDHIDLWVALHDRCAALSVTRNRLAHGQHILNSEGQPGRRWGIVDWSEQEPIRVTKSGVSIISTALCLNNVVTARLHFRRLTGELASLQQQLRGRPALPPEFFGPEPDRNHIRDLLPRIQQALGIQQEPSAKRPPRPDH